jgi:bacteriocin biosynthesis cyclodehydratase domain-containing protein
MSSLITILSDKSTIYASDNIELPLKNLSIEVNTVNTFEEVDPQSDLVIVLHAEKQGRVFNTYALKNGLTWLPVQFSHTLGRIGPIMIPDVSACYECLQLRCASNGVVPLVPKETHFDLSWCLISGIVAMETIKWVSRNTNSFAPLSLGHLIEFDAFYLQGDVNPVYKLPTCPACGVRHQAHLAAQPWRESDLVHQT